MERVLAIPKKWADALHSHRERQAYLELVETHGPSLVAMLRGLCRNGQDVDDVFQETAVRVWRNWSSRPRLRNPRAWLMTIGYRAFLDCRARRPTLDSFVDAPDHRLAAPEGQAEHAEECGRLKAAVEQLPPTIREVVVLHYTGALSLRETAQAMGISPGTAKSRLNSALEKLRSLLE